MMTKTLLLRYDQFLCLSLINCSIALIKSAAIDIPSTMSGVLHSSNSYQYYFIVFNIFVERSVMVIVPFLFGIDLSIDLLIDFPT